MIIADSVIDWGALWQVIWISAVAGIAIATVLGVGIVASLHGMAVCWPKKSDMRTQNRSASTSLSATTTRLAAPSVCAL